MSLDVENVTVRARMCPVIVNIQYFSNSATKLWRSPFDEFTEHGCAVFQTPSLHRRCCRHRPPLLPQSTQTIIMSELCPVYAPFFGALVRFFFCFYVGRPSFAHVQFNRDALAQSCSLVSLLSCHSRYFEVCLL